VRLIAIQHLRAIAALLVVVHHALTTADQYRLGESGLANFGEFYLFGNAGVDIFFVVSGFIMMYTLAQRRGQDTWHGFLWRRVKRVVPLYWLLTTALLALMLVAPMLFPNSRLDLGHVLASYLFVPFPDTQGRLYPLLVPGWTLTFEMIFYTLFAAMLFLREQWLIPALALVFGTFILAVELLVPGHRVLGWLANPIVFEFVFGCFIARLYLNLKTPPAWLPNMLGALAIALFGLTIMFHTPWLSRALAWGVPAMLLVAAAAWSPTPQRVGRASAAFAALGDASYSLYLVHPFVLPAVAKAWRLPGLETYLPADSYVWAATIASCVLALGTYHILERPLGLALAGKKWPTPRRPRLRPGFFRAASALAALVLAVLALVELRA
jgi:exopolysaccharide production protein ExoZ